ncbi:hypothetical protein GUJ93_ZPchr0010g8529 [Zizania palustris]|uniref:Protein XRI1 n=1 Tax=Zizania palustris TaxID=103762 RepID=A0A8J5WB46_ZIZPA|nr:hypothetical protein GUJ93_ZPchr0010g8529 [Zizania palustris]
MDMETAAQERERQQARWPLETMACSCLDEDDRSCFLFGWVPPLRYFGFGLGVVGAADDDDDPHGHTHTSHRHELDLFFPKYMETAASEAAAAVTGLPTPPDTGVMDEEFDELLQNFWDTNEEQLARFDPSSFLRENSADITSFLDSDDDLLALSSVWQLGSTLPEKKVAEQQPPSPSSASSNCNVGPQVSDTSPVRAKNSCSSKRSATPEGTETAASSKRRRARAEAPSGGAGGATTTTSVVYPFTVVKPGGLDLDGGATLADINARILTPPAKPVRHPVGEFACAPRAAAGNRPAPSGKTVAGFTRLHTAGRGTVTIIRTTG